MLCQWGIWRVDEKTRYFLKYGLPSVKIAFLVVLEDLNELLTNHVLNSVFTFTPWAPGCPFNPSRPLCPCKAMGTFKMLSCCHFSQIRVSHLCNSYVCWADPVTAEVEQGSVLHPAQVSWFHPPPPTQVSHHNCREKREEAEEASFHPCHPNNLVVFRYF